MPLEDALARVPGLAGYLGQQQFQQQQQSGQLGQMGSLLKIHEMLRQQQQEQELNQALKSSGGDLEKALPALIQAGHIKGEHLTAAMKLLSDSQAKKEAIQAMRDLNAPQTGQPQELGTGQPVAPEAGASPTIQPTGNDAQIARVKALQVQYAGNATAATALQKELDRLQGSGTPSVHIIQDKTSPTGWSYGDAKQEGKILMKGAPPPTSATQQQAANAITPETIKQMAQRYRVDGTLPSMGYGASGAIVRGKILNEAAAQAAAEGSSGEAERIRQVGLGSLKQALGQLEKNRANITAFENTAARNADLVLQESAKVDRIGSPIIDRWILAGKKQIAGDPSVARLDLAMRTFVNEYARVTTSVTGGGITSDTARREIDSLLQSAQTKEQVKQVIDLAKQEMKNRLKAYDDEVGNLRQRMQINPSSAPSSIEAPASPGGWSQEKERRYQELKAQQNAP